MKRALRLRFSSRFGLAAVVALLLLLASSLCFAAEQESGSVFILPFANQSNRANLDWMSESFVQAFSTALQDSPAVVLSREERAEIFDQAGIPLLPTLSRATLIRLAEDVDAAWMITGSFQYDGSMLNARAELVDLRREHLVELPIERGRLQDLEDIQRRLAWAARKQIDPQFAVAEEEFVTTQPRIALSAYENYIRGLLAEDPRIQLHYFRQAIELQPDYSSAMFELGQWYFDDGNAGAALQWLSKVSRTDRHYPEAQFLAGLAAFRVGQFERAASLYQGLAADFPLPEVLNNLALAEARQHHRGAADILLRAVQQAPDDNELKVNLAAYYYSVGERLHALTWLQQARIAGSAAQALAQAIRSTAPPTPAIANAAEALKQEFPADTFRQLQAAVVQFNAARATELSGAARVRFHLNAGDELLAKGALSAAEKEFRAAAVLDPADPQPHVDLARLFAQRQQWATARQEAEQALRTADLPDAHVVLAQVLLATGQSEQARREIDAALRLSPDNTQARALEAELKDH